MERPLLAVTLRRSALLLATALLLAPASAGAQLMPLQDDPARGSKFRVTPFVGWATEVDREETWSVPGAEGTAMTVTTATLGGGPVAGATVEYAFRDRWSLLLGGMYMSRDVGGFLLDTAAARVLGSDTVQAFTSSKAILAKAGVSLQLVERESELTLRRLGASLFVAPFYMLDMPDEVVGAEGAEIFDSANHFGINFGATGELPFATDRLAFQLAFEDYFTFWSDDVLTRWTEFQYGTGAVAEADPSHQWVIRAGLTFRMP